MYSILQNTATEHSVLKKTNQEKKEEEKKKKISVAKAFWFEFWF